MDEKPPAPDENLLTQQYPSPTADGQDTPFYDINHEENQVDNIMEDRGHPIENPIEHDLNQQALKVVQAIETRVQQAQQEQEHLPQQQTDSKQEDSNRDVAEELRLAAQLSQGLAPIMAEAANSSALPDGIPQDQSLHEQSEDSSLAKQDYGQAQEPMHPAQDTEAQAQEHHLHNILPLGHHDPQHQHQVHQYADHGQQQHLGHVSMALLAGADNTPPRKRSKASRACDECRRKKVKCDAVSETSDEPCSNCRRSQIECRFSRIPQKRGPSKGYIKELADRIHSIEGKLVGQANSADVLDIISRRESSDTFTPLNENAKRPFSSMSRDVLATPESNRHAGWATRPGFSNANLAPQPIVPKQETPTQPARDAQPEGLVPSVHNVTIRELDDGIFNAYLEFIHRVLPFLPGSKLRLEADLSQCSPSLQDAFRSALLATIQSFFPGSSQLREEAKTATRTLAIWESDGTQHSSGSELAHLQILLLLAIEADNNGPLAVKGQHGGPSKTSFLARAVAVAYSMDLRNLLVDRIEDNDPDPESAGRTALRAWWSLVALDRWNATGTGEPLLIHQDSVVLSSSLRLLLGESAFQFIKLSYLLGPSVSLFYAPARALALTSPSCATFSRRNNAALEMWRLDLPDTMTPATHPLIHLAYWHCRLLDYLLMPSALGSDVAWAAKETISMLAANEHLHNPFNHYFTCLAGVSLGELAKVDKTRDEATQFLNAEFLKEEVAIAPSAWDKDVRAKVAESLRPSTAQNLQQLADLATATGLSAAAAITTAAAAAVAATDRAEEAVSQPFGFRSAENYEDMGFDPRPMLRAGYLNSVRSPA